MSLIQFNDLPDDCLLMVFDQLSPDHLFKMLRVNKKLNRLAASKLRSNVKLIRLTRSISRPRRTPITDCEHLDSNSAKKVLVLNKLFKNSEQEVALLNDAPTKARFIGAFSKCPCVKSFDFGSYVLPGDVLLEVVRRCPELECIKLSVSLAEEDEWNQVLDQIGNQIVHFAKMFDWSINSDNEDDDNESGLLPSEVRFLELIVSKCPNIKQVDWMRNTPLPSEFMAVIKRLPPSCWIRLNSGDLFENVVYEDVVDELNADVIDWPALGQRLERLSSFKFYRPHRGLITAVDFFGLKKLDVSRSYLDLSSLGVCRFPRLEEFSFKAASVTEDGYEKLFKSMPTVKKLNITWQQEYFFKPRLPESSIRRLKNIEIIVLCISSFSIDWEPESLLQQLEQYIDGGDCNTKVQTLKKLTVDINHVYDYKWQTTVEEGVERMKAKQQTKQQNPVEIDLIFKK